MNDIDKILEYFDQKGDMYYPKNGYICKLEGFDDDLIIYFSKDDEGNYSFGTPDTDLKFPPKHGYVVSVYKMTKVA